MDYLIAQYLLLESMLHSKLSSILYCFNICPLTISNIHCGTFHFLFLNFDRVATSFVAICCQVLPYIFPTVWSIHETFISLRFRSRNDHPAQPTLKYDPTMNHSRLAVTFIHWFWIDFYVGVIDLAEVCEMNRQNKLSSLIRNQNNLSPMIRSQNNLSPVINICIVFILCSVSFIARVVLCAVFYLSVVCYFVWCVLFVCCVLL
jgi:hypothetical protein